MLNYGISCQGFLDGAYTEVIYHSLFLGAAWDCADCSHTGWLLSLEVQRGIELPGSRVRV